MNEVMVSIHCLTFNHEKSIRDALDGFLMQKTNFSYEILIHDDASTDATASIIRSYEKQYPDIIKPIYQTENQYSKGAKLTPLNISRAKGKYIASCEGDDFWTDPNKLQKQFDYMEAHPECSICVHGSKRISIDKKDLKCPIRPCTGNQNISTENIIIFRRSGFVQLSSYFYRREYTENLPYYYDIAPVGDYPLMLHLALQGDVYYFDELMSSYRVNNPGSWTDSIYNDNERYTKHVEEIYNMLDEFNKYTDYKYIDEINESKAYHSFTRLLKIGSFKEALSDEYKDFFMELCPSIRYKIRFKAYFPKTTRLIFKLMGRI
ncbi:MAG: glycosyltransferase family 2 protein [Solirubrobacterales bacterium]